MSGRAGMGELESAVMGALWAADRPVTVREVMSNLSDRDPAYTTVMTVLDRLAKKGLAQRERDGRAWRYTAASTREELTATALRSTLSALEGPSRKAALLHFLDGASPDEIADLRAALDDLD
ncbi:BlaI/MecI/CopY family transcriptional regulator [Demetria terragena]|uniref:BlaI/MecI/CopY family transcriptional regulator n=1 Tax=Demetria terragena TaxID=63959 RepID=UPI00037B9A1C|nr:BlaI/MecI/CopY family transcriptional regulator [Demetria terragena]